MKKLLLSILFISIALFAVDRIGGKIMWSINQNTQDSSAPKMKYLINDVSEDVILMGTSRCNLHYVPSIISDSLGLSVYNGGLDGTDNIFSHYCLLCHITSVHTPKLICLEISSNDYDTQNNDCFTSLSYFAPYIGINQKSDSLFMEAGIFWQYKVSHLYRYNAKAVSNIAGLLINKRVCADNGYSPASKPPSFPKTVVINESQVKVDSLKLQYVEKFIHLCEEENIQLIFMISPSYSLVSNDFYDVIKNVANKYNIPVFDYHSSKLFHDHMDYFKDTNHMWDKGARIYSSIFAEDLKKYLLQNTIQVRDSDF